MKRLIVPFAIAIALIVFCLPGIISTGVAKNLHRLASDKIGLTTAPADTTPPASTDTGNVAKEDLTLKGDATAGGNLFAKRCSGCHGDDAMGGRAPQLVGNKILQDDDKFWTTVLEGRNKMPMFKMKVTSQDIANVREYLKGLN